MKCIIEELTKKFIQELLKIEEKFTLAQIYALGCIVIVKLCLGS